MLFRLFKMSALIGVAAEMCGVDPKTVKRVDHYDIYGHLFRDRLDELASKLDHMIQRDEHSRGRHRETGRSL